MRSVRIEEEQFGIFVREVEWRSIEDFPGAEIDKEGRVRRIKSRIFYNTKAGGGESLRVMRNGKRWQRSIRELRNEAFPELKPW